MSNKVKFAGIEVNASSINDIMLVDMQDDCSLYRNLDFENRKQVLQNCSDEVLKLFIEMFDCDEGSIFEVISSGKSFKEICEISNFEEEELVDIVLMTSEEHRQYSTDELSLILKHGNPRDVVYLLESQNVRPKNDKIFSNLKNKLFENNFSAKFLDFNVIVNQLSRIFLTEQKPVKKKSASTKKK